MAIRRDDFLSLDVGDGLERRVLVHYEKRIGRFLRGYDGLIAVVPYRFGQDIRWPGHHQTISACCHPVAKFLRVTYRNQSDGYSERLFQYRLEFLIAKENIRSGRLPEAPSLMASTIRPCRSAPFAACFWAKALVLTASTREKIAKRKHSKIVLKIAFSIFPPAVRFLGETCSDFMPLYSHCVEYARANVRAKPRLGI